MLGKRLSLPLGAVLLAGLAFGPGQAAQASTAQNAPKTVVSTAQDVTTSTNTPTLVKAPPGPDHRRRQHRYDRDRRERHHRYQRHHRYERDRWHHRQRMHQRNW
jgi:hypothetical protein